jgi:collagen type VI alpha
MPFSYTDCNRRLDVAFALDVSGSTSSGSSFGHQFFEKLLYGFNIGQNYVRTSLVTFADNAEVRYYLDSYNGRSDMLGASTVVSPKGATNTQAALRKIREDVFQANRGDRYDVVNVVVVITDGASNVNASRTIPEANLLKESGANVFVVAIGDNVQDAEVVAMATDDAEAFIFRIRDETDVTAESDRFLTLLCG